MRAKYRVIERFKNKYPIWKMCELFEVSRSGFYKWRKRAASQQRSELDQIIIECQVLAKQTYGYRRVWLWMKQNKSVECHPLTVLHHMRKLDKPGVYRIAPKAGTFFHPDRIITLDTMCRFLFISNQTDVSSWSSQRFLQVRSYLTREGYEIMGEPVIRILPECIQSTASCMEAFLPVQKPASYQF